MRVWPGRPYPLGATWDGRGVNFALFSEHATKVELCLFDSPEATAESQRIRLPEQTDHGLARLPARRPARPALRLPRPRSLRAGRRAPLQPQQGAARSLRQGHRPRPALGRLRCSATRSATPTADLSFDERDNAAFAPLAAVVDAAFTWGDDRPPRTPWHKTLIYELHVKGFTKLPSRRAREAARHLRRPGLRGGHPAPAQTWASPPSSCCRSTTTSTTATWSRRADATTGATTRWPSSPPTSRYASTRLPRDVGARVQDDGPRPARRRHRGDPRRGLQPHGRGQPAGADAVASAASTTPRTTACRRTTRATTWTSPAAATRSTCSTRACCS